MPVITIKSENDLKELGNDLDEIKYKRSDGKIQGNHRIEPVFRFAENIYKTVSKVELGSLGDESSEELKNIFQILNGLTAAFVNIQRQRKLYRRGNILKNHKEKEKYVQCLKEFIILAKKLAKEVNAKKFETSLNKALNDCNSIIKNKENKEIKENKENKEIKEIKEIKEFENPFFELAEIFKNIKEQADKYLGCLNKKKYEREFERRGTIDIGKAINYLETYGQWYEEGNDKSIKNSYNEFKKNKLNLVGAAHIIVQGVSRQLELEKELCKKISVCINSPDQGNIKNLERNIKEANEFDFYDFKGDYKRFLDISKKVTDISKIIIQKENDTQTRVNVKKTVRMFEEKNMLKIYFSNANNLFEKAKKDVDRVNSALGYRYDAKVLEVYNLLNVI